MDGLFQWFFYITQGIIPRESLINYMMLKYSYFKNIIPVSNVGNDDL